MLVRWMKLHIKARNILMKFLSSSSACFGFFLFLVVFSTSASYLLRYRGGLSFVLQESVILRWILGAIVTAQKFSSSFIIFIWYAAAWLCTGRNFLGLPGRLPSTSSSLFWLEAFYCFCEIWVLPRLELISMSNNEIFGSTYPPTTW